MPAQGGAKKMKNTIAITLTLIGLAVSGQVNAVPCGDYASVGGVSPSISCRNSSAGDATDSAGDLNSGSFFGFSDWSQLDKTDDGINGSYWTVGPAGTGVVSGTFTLYSDIWSLYSDLVVVLKDGGSTTNSAIKWAAYLLPSGVLGPYDWSFDNHKRVSHMSLYARGTGTPPTRVPEPATLLLVLTGLAGIGLARRLRRRV
jgi:hypothetical protein